MTRSSARRASLLVLLAWPSLALLLAVVSCGDRRAPSPAADEIIATAEDGEEKAGLTQARDDIDDEMRRTAQQKDEEIRKLREENDALRKKLRR